MITTIHYCIKKFKQNYGFYYKCIEDIYSCYQKNLYNVYYILFINFGHIIMIY